MHEVLNALKSIPDGGLFFLSVLFSPFTISILWVVAWPITLLKIDQATFYIADWTVRLLIQPIVPFLDALSNYLDQHLEPVFKKIR